MSASKKKWDRMAERELLKCGFWASSSTASLRVHTVISAALQRAYRLGISDQLKSMEPQLLSLGYKKVKR